VLLRRRRIPSFPLWAIGLDVVCSVALTFGQTRYRTTFEVSLVLLAAVQLEWFWSRLRRGSDSDQVAGQGPATESAPPDTAAELSPGVPDVAAATT
jgi:hypothetical protein